MKPQLIRQLVEGRLRKTLTLTFISGEVVNSKIIAVGRDLEEDVDFYYIDLDRAPTVALLEERGETDSSLKPHVYGASFRELREVEIPQPERPQPERPPSDE